MLRSSRSLAAALPALSSSGAGAGAGSSAAIAGAASRSMASIVYTHTDEAPALATYSLLPIIRRFTDPAGIDVELSDISVSGRILSHFPERLTEEQRVPDHLSRLGEMCQNDPLACIIKLPNVSASVPQLKAAIAELQSQGYNIPDYPASPKTDEEKAIHATYAKVLGSAVNPVLREGNSDRRVAGPVKAFAQKHPSKMIKPWADGCRSHVSHMDSGDFYESEQSATMTAPTTVRIEFEADGKTTVMKESLDLLEGEVIDASLMSASKLRAFYEKEISDAKESGIMVSLHLKATMMKVSDPILFGHCVSVYYKDALEKHAAVLSELGANVNNGIGDVYEKIKTLPEAQRAEIEADLAACYETRPGLAMVDSRRGITNLHVPSDVIIDASMPNVVRDAGGMWNKDDALEDVKCLIPDRCYAGIYQEILEDCRTNGQFDPSTMGNVANVGLMAQKAEEYGSHDKTFEIPADGTMRVVNAATGETLFAHSVSEGDVWRSSQTKDAPIKDWVRLAVSRARATGSAAIFWLDAARAHDAQIIAKVNKYLPDHDTSGLDISIQTPREAMRTSCARARAGKDTISVTGNVLRDYLTDLFPILELGTSAKMLSIVPMLNGGCMYETGAGGSAPKHVQQFVEEGHLRWDSLGEYLAMATALEDLGEKTNNERATLLGKTLMAATGKLLDDNLSPSRKAGEIDNRGSNVQIAVNWAEAVAAEDPAFKDLASKLKENEEKIMQDLIDCQGSPVDIGGYFHPDAEKTGAAMRSSATFNDILDESH